MRVTDVVAVGESQVDRKSRNIRTRASDSSTRATQPGRTGSGPDTELLAQIEQYRRVVAGMLRGRSSPSCRASPTS
jgi:hypothetical protein